MRPVVDELSKTYEGRITAENTDFNSPAGRELAAKAQVTGHPTVVIVNRQGREVGRVYSPSQKELLRSHIDKALSQ